MRTGSPLAMAGALLLSGCSFFGPRMQTVSVTSDPIGANVAINGVKVGQTPVQHQVHRGKDLLIEVRKPGYETQYRNPSRGLSGVGMADALVGAVLLLPLLGLISPAAWEHDPANFGIIMNPADPRSQP